jgi:NTE family protein
MVRHAADLGARTIYVLEVGVLSRPQPEPARPLGALRTAYWIIRRNRYQRQIDALPDGVEVHLLPAGEPPRLRFHDFTRSAELIRAAYVASSAHLDDLEASAEPG